MINDNPILDDLVNNKEEFLLLIREAIGQVAYYRRLLERYEVDALWEQQIPRVHGGHINVRL